MAKLDGQFHWHKHDNTDDFLFVLKGTLDVELRDRTLNLGDIFVVPTGVEHRPVVRGEVHLLLIEPTGTRIRVIRLRQRRAFSLDRFSVPTMVKLFLAASARLGSYVQTAANGQTAGIQVECLRG